MEEKRIDYIFITFYYILFYIYSKGLRRAVKSHKGDWGIWTKRGRKSCVGGGSVWAYCRPLSGWAARHVGDVLIWAYRGPLGHWVAHRVRGGRTVVHLAVGRLIVLGVCRFGHSVVRRAVGRLVVFVVGRFGPTVVHCAIGQFVAFMLCRFGRFGLVHRVERWLEAAFGVKRRLGWVVT